MLIKNSNLVRTILLAGRLLLQPGTLCLRSGWVLLSLAALIVAFGLTPAHPVSAQTFRLLHEFTARSSDYATNRDGSYPVGRLVANLSSSTLYETANIGGGAGFGTVFSVNTDGTGFATLHSFMRYTNGTQPRSGVILSGHTLYGTAWQGGLAGNGTVFALNTDGTGFTIVHTFTAISALTINSDGTHPRAGLILSGNTLYGTAMGGGSWGRGRCSKSTPMARVLRTCMTSTVTKTGADRMLWFYWATLCMALRGKRAARTTARCSVFHSCRDWRSIAPPPMLF